MRTVSVREITRHFSKHADLACDGEDVRVFRDGKPYVRIVADASEKPPPPVVNYAARAKANFGNRKFSAGMLDMMIKNRR